MINYEKQLTTDILPFWLRQVDRVNGGIFTCVDEQGDIYGEEKSVWFQGRALWTFAKAYNVIKKDADYLAAADRIYMFLEKCVDSDGRMYFTVTADGRGIQKRRYYFRRHLQPLDVRNTIVPVEICRLWWMQENILK